MGLLLSIRRIIAIAYSKALTENDGADYTAIHTIDDIKEMVTKMATKQEENND